MAIINDYFEDISQGTIKNLMTITQCFCFKCEFHSEGKKKRLVVVVWITHSMPLKYDTMKEEYI